MAIDVVDTCSDNGARRKIQVTKCPCKQFCKLHAHFPAAPTFAAFITHNDKYYECKEPLTVAEFRAFLTKAIHDFPQ